MTRNSITRIFHPSDFSQGDLGAFAHALKIAVAAHAELDLLHVDEPEAIAHWSEFPGIRSTLVDWGLLPVGATKEAIAHLGIKVRKIQKVNTDPTRCIVEHVNEHRPDLVVLATHQRRGFSRLLHGTLAESISRQSGTMTLFVPRRIVGFVSQERGTVRLENILVPVDRVPSPQRAIDAAARLAAILGCNNLRFTFLYVGKQEDMPHVRVPDQPGWTFERAAWDGDVVEHILASAEEHNADLVVMATQGHQGFLDALRGSTTERVLRQLKCPLLAVPAH